jgi:type IX secretion system PorP/SprF family membrane protein
MKHALRIHILTALLLLCSAASAQQDPLYSMYMWNMMTVNPAYAGSPDVMNATVLSRHQWMGVDGAPVTNSLMVHSPLKWPSLGLGLSVVDDRIGPSNSTGFHGDFACRVRITKEARLAFGLKAGATMLHMNMSDIPGTDETDPVFQGATKSGLQPNFGFGLYYWSKKGYLGAAVPKLLRDSYVAESAAGTANVFTSQAHAFLIGGYVFTLSQDVKFRPSFLLKAVEGAPLSGDVSANFLFVEKLWVGAAYRTQQELSAILSYQITEQLRAGYAYDLSLAPIRTGQRGSHEIMLGYDLRFTKRTLRSPRYF